MQHRYDEYLREAKVAAHLAWEAMRPYFRGKFEIFEKVGEGPATDGDLAADRAILKHLKEFYPTSEFGYLTEETEKEDERLKRNACWIIDPIDGTREFIEGRDDFAVHIGLAIRDENSGTFRTVLGLVYRAVRQEMYWAVEGEGAFVEDEKLNEIRRLRVNDISNTDDSAVVVTRSTFGPRLQGSLDTIAPDRIYPLGSLGIKAMEVAQGHASLYINTAKKGCKEWDLCAPSIILEEAGGKVTNLRGEPITYNKADYQLYDGLLLSNGHVHQVVLERLQSLEILGLN